MPEKNSEVDMGPLPRASSSRQVIEIQDSELEEGEINDEPEVELVSESKSASCMPEEQPAFSRSNKRQRTSTEGLISPGKKKKKERKLLDPEHSAPSLNPEATPFQGTLEKRSPNDG